MFNRMRQNGIRGANMPFTNTKNTTSVPQLSLPHGCLDVCGYTLGLHLAGGSFLAVFTSSSFFFF